MDGSDQTPEEKLKFNSTPSVNTNPKTPHSQLPYSQATTPRSAAAPRPIAGAIASAPPVTVGDAAVAEPVAAFAALLASLLAEATTDERLVLAEAASVDKLE